MIVDGMHLLSQHSATDEDARNWVQVIEENF